MNPEILWLSGDDVAACDLPIAEVNAAVESAFASLAKQRAGTRPALSIPGDDRSSFRAKGGVLLDDGFAAAKWYGYFPGNPARGIAEYRPLILLSETVTGLPVAVINGDWITASRTAAISAVGARHLARPGSRTVAFVGCGGQARANLLALAVEFGTLNVIACGNRPESTDAFIGFARKHGHEAYMASDPRSALAEADIVVSSVPRLAARTGFLDAGWVRPGGFAAMVDIGVAWDKSTISRFDGRFSDDVDQSLGHVEQGDAQTSYAAGLAEVVAGKAGRRNAGERLALVFSGTGIADAAVAAAVYRRAKALSIGRELPF